MRTTRKLVVLAVMVTATMALGAALASAQRFVIGQEDNATRHCPPVESARAGGCEVHFYGQGFITNYAFGLETAYTHCFIDLQIRLDEDAEGYVYDGRYIRDETHDCTRTMCDLPWPIGDIGPHPTGEGSEVHIELCSRPPQGPPSKCRVGVLIDDDSTHGYGIYFRPAILGVPLDRGLRCGVRDGDLIMQVSRHEIEVLRRGDDSGLPAR